MEIQLDFFHQMSPEEILHEKIIKLKEEMANVRRGIFQRVGEVQRVQEKEINAIELIMHRLDVIERKIANVQ